MGRRSRKQKRNFCWDTCETYPRCRAAECEYFDTCDHCETPVCQWVAVATGFDLLCRECYEMLKATGAPLDDMDDDG